MPADALLSETEKREIWHLRSEGLLPSQIAQAIGRGAPTCLLYTSPSPRDQRGSRMPSSA